MVIDTQSALKALAIVLRNEEGNNTATSSVKSAIVTGLSTFGGGLLGGPRGIIPGAIIGSALSYFMKKDSFKSILEVIDEDLTTAEKLELAHNVQQVISSFGVDDIAVLMSLAAGNMNFQHAVLDCAKSFVNTHVSQANSG